MLGKYLKSKFFMGQLFSRIESLQKDRPLKNHLPFLPTLTKIGCGHYWIRTSDFHPVKVTL